MIGVSVVEIEVDPDKAVMVVRLKSVTTTNGKRTGKVPESLVEGGVITLDRPIVTTRSNAGTMENTTTMKRSVGKRYETQLQLADNSRTTHRTPTTKIVMVSRGT